MMEADSSVLYYLTLEDVHGGQNERPITVRPKVRKNSQDEIRIYISCPPFGNFDLVVPVSCTIEEIGDLVHQRVRELYETEINVINLQSGDGSIMKVLPPEYAIGELLSDDDEVGVVYTTQTEYPEKDEVEDEEPEQKNSVFRCPYKFFGPHAIRELKQHLEISGVKPNSIRIPRGPEIQCPVYFFNEQDACQHIQAVVYANQQREFDFKVFWDLIKSEEEDKEQKTKKKELKKKKKKRLKDNKQKKKKQLEEQQRIQRELDEQALQIEKEKQKLEKQKQKEQQRIQKEMLEKAILLEKERLKKERKKKKQVEDSIRQIVSSVIQNAQGILEKKKDLRVPTEDSLQSPSPPPRSPKPAPNGVSESRKEKDVAKPGYFSSLEERLHKEIEEYVEGVRAIVASQRERVESMIKRVREVVHFLWPSAQVEVYGSYATSLCIPDSDLDLIVIGATPTNGQTTFSTLFTTLQKQEWVQSCTAIETAKFPVIKIMGTQEGIPTDITFDGEDVATFVTQGGLLVRHSGLSSCELISSYVNLMPELAPMAMVLKKLLYERGLKDPRNGGLSSYCLVLMLVSFLQIYGKRLNGNCKSPLGALLLNFLELYGKKFDYNSTGISVSPQGGHFALETARLKFPISSLVIVDPFNPANNISKHVCLEKVKSLWEEAHTALVSPFYNGFTPASLLSRILHNQPSAKT